MNPETYPHRKDTAYGMSPDCRCGADDAGAVGIGETWGTDCPAALREALEEERVARTGVELELAVQTGRAAGPHIPPALMRRIEALGFTPGSGEPVGWLVAELERLKADHTALLLGVGHPMWLPSVADAVDHPDQFNATPDEVLHRVRAVVAERDELAATLANERGEGEPPVGGFEWTEPDPHFPDSSGIWSGIFGRVRIYAVRRLDGWSWCVDSAQVCPVTSYAAGMADTARAAMRDGFAARSAGGGAS